MKINHLRDSDKLKIIIVDDNEIFRQSLREFISKKLGHQVISEAENGVEFLQLPKLAEADIVLMDLAMPEMGGIEAVKKALWQYNYLNCIAITLYSHKAYLLELIGAGFKGFVSKTSVFEDLEYVLIKVKEQKYAFPDDLMFN